MMKRMPSNTSAVDDEKEELAFHESQFVDDLNEAGRGGSLIPWKAVLFTICLFTIGAIMLMLGALTFLGIIGADASILTANSQL
jgi:hypothetical protein